MNNRIKLLVVCLLLLIIIFITSKSLSNIFSENTISQDVQINTIEHKQPIITPSEPWVVPPKHDKDYISLQYESGGVWTDVYAYLNYKLHLITDDYLFIDTSGQEKVRLAAFNYKTGKEYVILNRSNNFVESINQVIRIGNTIFFSTNAYLRPSYAYYIDLPVEQNMAKEIEGLGRNATIEKVSGKYVIVEGDGDVCSAGGTYLLFNPETKQAQKFAEYRYGCGEGNMINIVGDRLLNYYTHASATSYGEGIFARITYFDFGITDTPKEIDLISENQMPANITDVYYDEETDSLLLNGKDRYVFHIKTHELKKEDFTTPKSVRKDDLIFKNLTSEEKIEKLKSLPLPKSFRFSFGDK